MSKKARNHQRGGEVQAQLRTAEVVHADETGLRVNALLAWVHAVPRLI